MTYEPRPAYVKNEPLPEIYQCSACSVCREMRKTNISPAGWPGTCFRYSAAQITVTLAGVKMPTVTMLATWADPLRLKYGNTRST